jgi:hypothetical protein
MNLLALNLDILVHILDQLHHADIFHFALASHKSYTIATPHLFRHIKLEGPLEVASFTEFIDSRRGAALRASIRSLVVDIEEYIAGMDPVSCRRERSSEERMSHLNELTRCSERVVHILGQLRALRRLELFDAGYFMTEDFEAVMRGLPCLSAIGLTRTEGGIQLLSQIDRPLDTILIPDFFTYRDKHWDEGRGIRFNLSHFSSTLRTLSLDGRDLATLPPQLVFSQVTHLIVWGSYCPFYKALHTVFPNLRVLEYLTTYVGARARARSQAAVVKRKQLKHSCTSGLVLYTDIRDPARIGLFRLSPVHELVLEVEQNLVSRGGRLLQFMQDLSPTVISLHSWVLFCKVYDAGLPFVLSVKRVFTSLPKLSASLVISHLVCVQADY